MLILAPFRLDPKCSKCGHLLDGRFKAKLVDGDDYLLALSRYVHLNPVQVGAMKDKPIVERIEALRAWRWSSYPSCIGQRKPPDFIQCGPLLSEMNGKRRAWPKRYREFVESGLAKTDDDFKSALKASPRSIGGDGFRAWVEELYQKRVEAYARPEDVVFRPGTEPLPADEVLAVLCRIFWVEKEAFLRRSYDSALRAVAGRFLIQYAGFSQRDAASHLQAGRGVAMSNQLKRLRVKLATVRRLRNKVKQADAALRQSKTERIKSRVPVIMKGCRPCPCPMNNVPSVNNIDCRSGFALLSHARHGALWRA